MYDFMIYRKGFRMISGYTYLTKRIAKEKGEEFLKNTYPIYANCALKVIKLKKKSKEYRLKLALKEKVISKLAINKFKRNLRKLQKKRCKVK